MTTALVQLVDNAVKYAAEGGDLTLQVEDAGATSSVDVLDRGPGVPQAQREQIFEKFFRGDDSLTARHPGSGLGLSIARGLLRGMGGDVRYEPRDGGGSRFTIVLRHALRRPA